MAALSVHKLMGMIAAGQGLFHPLKNFFIVDTIQIGSAQGDDSRFFVQGKQDVTDVVATKDYFGIFSKTFIGQLV